MRKLILSEHVSLDGFAGGPNGEMNWIKLDETLFDFVGRFTEEADTALYGRVTYQMMENYWPTAADQPNASKHDIEHSSWYKKVEKVVLSRTLMDQGKDKTTFISEDILQRIAALKQQSGKNILMFGSPGAAHSLMEHNLIDEYWLFVNPVLLGKGIPLFGNIRDKINLKLASAKEFPCGVIAMNFVVER